MKYHSVMCLECGQNIEYAEERSGQVIACPNCAAKLSLPGVQPSDRHGVFPKLLNALREARHRVVDRKQLRQLKETVLSLVSDGVLTNEEKALLKQREAELGLVEDDMRHWGREIFEAAFRGASQHGHISPEREAELLEIQEYLNLVESEVPQIKAEIRRSRRLFEIQHGNIPPVQASNVVLKDGESADWIEPGTLYEEKVVSRHYEGGSSGVSFRVVKGVSFRVGVHRGQLVAETGNVAVSSGRLIITDRRMIFQGDRKSFAADFEKIVEMNPAPDGIRFSESNREKPRLILYGQPNGEFVCEVLSHFMEHRLGRRV